MIFKREVGKYEQWSGSYPVDNCCGEQTYQARDGSIFYVFLIIFLHNDFEKEKSGNKKKRSGSDPAFQLLGNFWKHCAIHCNENKVWRTDLHREGWEYFLRVFDYFFCIMIFKKEMGKQENKSG